ncbi:MAG: hypothetical protein JXC32_12255 [Anaerolineae bacterium]|nr:hypothetical protein [Anaerolineae bacterium]
MADHSAYFEETWPLLQQAAIYRPGTNPTFQNPDFATAAMRVLIVRLSPFRDVVRSSPHLFLFQAVRRALSDAYIDVAFFPPEHDRARWLADGLPLLIGTQSRHGLLDFDIVLISNAYTLELINLPYLLIHSDVPVLASQRDATYPVLILGGSNAMASQAVITPEGDAVIDAIFFGEGEREVETLIASLHAEAALPKRERLAAAAQRVGALWVANGGPNQTVVEAVCHAPALEDLVVDYPSLNSEEASTARLQINYGCPAFCSFCFEGYDRKPYREVALQTILAAADRLKASQGVEAVDVYSFNFNTHEGVLQLLLDLNRRFDRVSVTSQRVDLLAAMPSLLEAEVRADKRSFTLGIEGISHRMRSFLHKSLSDVEIETVLVRLMQQKIREIKLFYILTGHETQEDLNDFHRFVLQLKAWRQRYSRGLRIVFSFGLLIRMPFTPLRYDRLFLDEAAWRQITGPVKASCETNGFEFRLATPWDEYAASQVLALGGTWLHEPVIALARQGHLYDLDLSPGYWEALQAWMEANGYWHEGFLGEKMSGYDFALSFVKRSVDGAMLYRQYEQAVAGVDEGYCLGEVGVPGVTGAPGRCLGCGACTNIEEREAITRHTMQHPGTGYLQELAQTMRTKWRLQPVYARMWLLPLVAHADPAWTNALVMRSLLEAYPELVGNLLSAQEVLFTTRSNVSRYTGLFGETVMALKAWDPSRLGQALAGGGALPDGVCFIGFLDQFTPGDFDRVALRVTLDADHFPDAGRALRRCLLAQYVPVNLRGEGDGYVFDIPAKSLKKRVIFVGQFRETVDWTEIQITVSPKFDLVGYLSSFTEPGRYREARVEVLSLVL